PGGVIGFSRWNAALEPAQAYRLFAVAWATLLSEGVADPAAHLAMASCGQVSTLVLSNRPLTDDDRRLLHTVEEQRAYRLDFVPGEPPQDPILRRISEARSLADLDSLRDLSPFDLSPVYDRSPFFFNALRLRHLWEVVTGKMPRGNARALGFLMLFLLT